MFRLFLIMLFFTLDVSAQSVSPWKKIAPASFGDVATPSPGKAYMTVWLRKAAAYQNSNFWTNWVEKNRQSVLTINLAGTISGAPVAMTKVGLPIQLKKNKSMVDLGYSGVIVDHLPMTFSGLNLSMQINKTAEDGVDDMISMVSSMSSAQPAILSVSQQAMGAVTLTKSLADFLFSRQLLEQQMTTQSALPASGLLPPGIYVCFAADTDSEYSSYLASGDSLRWDGAQLAYKGLPVTKVTYFVIEVGYQSRFFAEPIDALAFGATRPWVTLFLLAEEKLRVFDSAADAEKVRADIAAHLSDARSLLRQDYDFTQSEKDAIYDAVWKRIDQDYRQKVAAIPSTNATSTLVKPALSGVTEQALDTIYQKAISAARPRPGGTSH